MKRGLVLYSGGQDSTTCLFWAIRQYGKEQVEALGFDYGQRHRTELEAAAQLCRENQIPYQILDLRMLAQLAPNALTDVRIQMDGNDYPNDYPNTYVEGRNHLFLSFAAIYAKQRAIRNIITGVCQTDFSGYPDCRDNFVKSLNVTLNLAMDYNFDLITPLMWMDKKQIWQLADQLGCFEVIREKTITCYHGIGQDGCGRCPACRLRNKGYQEYLKEQCHE